MMGREFHSGQSGGELVAISSLSTEGEKKRKKKKKEVKSPLQSLLWSVRILFLSLLDNPPILQIRRWILIPLVNTF